MAAPLLLPTPSSEYPVSMLILKYFLTVGLALTAGLWALSAYLGSGNAARASHPVTTATTTSLAVFKPTPAPAVATTALEDVPVIAPKAEKPARSSAPRRAPPRRETAGWDHQNPGWQNRSQGWGQSQGGWGGWGHRQF
jgi:hypothetical protein